jgi:hypothetical protein
MSLLPQACTAVTITPFYHEGAQGCRMVGGDEVARGFQYLIVVTFVAAPCGHAPVGSEGYY